MVIKIFVSTIALLIGQTSLTQPEEGESHELGSQFQRITDWETIHFSAAFFWVTRIILLLISFKKNQVCHLFYYNEMILILLMSFVYQEGLKDDNLMLENLILTNLLNFACLYTNYWAGFVCTVIINIFVMVSREFVYRTDWSLNLILSSFCVLFVQCICITCIHLFMTKMGFIIVEKQVELSDKGELLANLKGRVIVIDKEEKNVLF